MEWEFHSQICQSSAHCDGRLDGKIEEVLARIAASGESGRRRYVREQEAAKYIGVSVSALRSWRTKRSKNGPPFTRLGKMVLYPVAQLDEHMRTRTVPAKA